MDQKDFTSVFTNRPQNFAWFLGAGSSRSSGLPTAYDVIWDLKRRYYCQQESQDIVQQDLQIEAVAAKIQAYCESLGLPAENASGEYETYFEKIFGEDKERQRRYLSAILAEDRARLSVGNRVLGALIAANLSKAIFTTNFDSVVEKAVAEVGGSSLAAHHIEGARSAIQALNNEEFPLYCKLHGDFRHDTIKNLPADLASQNDDLAKCFVAAANRFGFIVVGYTRRVKA